MTGTYEDLGKRRGKTLDNEAEMRSRRLSEDHRKDGGFF